MSKKLRLDKLLANMGIGTRKEIKKMAKGGAISVNGIIAKDTSMHIDPEHDEVKVYNQEVKYREFIYLMLNKPQGVVSATSDLEHSTVVDLLDEEYWAFEPFPVGRLDIDTEGLLLLTNDGKLAHKLLSPKKHVPKLYYARVEGLVSDTDIKAFAKGVILDDGYKTLPAELRILVSDNISEVEVTIHEGKFHQIKRMFESVDKRVVYLKRLSMANLVLDENLDLGEYRELTESELQELTDYEII